jgi:hypothetical protein
LRKENRLRVSENRVLRIFGPKREEKGSWRKLHIDELHNLFSSLNVFKSRTRWAGHVARMREGRVFTGFWLGGPEVRDHWKELGVGERITLS